MENHTIHPDQKKDNAEAGDMPPPKCIINIVEFLERA